MSFIRQDQLSKVKKSIIKNFIDEYWFIPSDVLQRATEASIWDSYKLTQPILSIGIGNGELDKVLFKKQGIMEVGIDIDDSQFETARSLNIYRKVIKVNAEKMPFRSSSFSSIVSNSTLEHIKDDKRAISEISRVLKLNGLLLITTPSNFLQDWIIEYEESRNRNKSKNKLKQFNLRIRHYHYHSYEEWKKMLNKNDLEITLHKYYFPKGVAVFWYKLLKLFTYKIMGKELWSYLGHSKFTKFLPKQIIMRVVEKLLKSSFESAIINDSSPGAQHFIIARKIK